MNQEELKALSDSVNRRMVVRRLLKEWEEGSDAPATPEQRQAIRQLLQEKAEDYARLEEALRRLSEQLDRMGDRPADLPALSRPTRLRLPLAAPLHWYADTLLDPYKLDWWC
jgi:uncharacterized membrane protein YccC